VQAAIRVLEGRTAAVTHRAVAAEASVSVALTPITSARWMSCWAPAWPRRPAPAPRLAHAIDLARARQIFPLDACADHPIDLLGPRRVEFLVSLEIRLFAARRDDALRGEQADAAFADLQTVR